MTDKYFYKELYAANKSRKNAEMINNDVLSGLLDNIATARHVFHCEDAKNIDSKLSNAYGVLYNAVISAADELSKIGINVAKEFPFSDDDNGEIFDSIDYYESYKDAYESLISDASGDELTDYELSEVVEYIAASNSEAVNRINNAVENILRLADEKLNTHYAPTGYARNMI